MQRIGDFVKAAVNNEQGMISSAIMGKRKQKH
jgi:hypothetical protein